MKPNPLFTPATPRPPARPRPAAPPRAWLLGLVVGVLLPLGWLRAWAAETVVVPETLNYQGRLETLNGAPYTNGLYTIEFRVWNQSAVSGATLLWGESYSVYVKDGRFNVVIGPGQGGTVVTNSPAPKFSNLRDLFKITATETSKERWLGITVRQDEKNQTITNPTESYPRQQWLCTPFAIQSQYAMYASQSLTNGIFTVPAGLTVSAGKTTVQGGFESTSGLSVTGGTAAELRTGLTVSNMANLNGGVTVSGTTATIKNGLDVTGATTLRGGATISGGATVSGAMTNSGNLQVNGKLTVTNGLAVTGAATTLGNGATISGGLNSGGGTVLSGSLTNTGDCVINGKLTVTNVAKFQSLDGAIITNAAVTIGAGSTKGLQFQSDPGGGSYDNAWLRYSVNSGESCTLELGVANDADDNLRLKASGTVEVYGMVSLLGSTGGSTTLASGSTTTYNAARDGILIIAGYDSKTYLQVDTDADGDYDIDMNLYFASSGSDTLLLTIPIAKGGKAVYKINSIEGSGWNNWRWMSFGH